MMQCRPVFGTRLFNAGHPTDSTTVMRLGQFKGLAMGFGHPPEPEDLVVLRHNGTDPEPFEVEQPIKAVQGMDGFPPVWLAHLESLLRLQTKRS